MSERLPSRRKPTKKDAIGIIARIGARTAGKRPTTVAR